MTWKMARTALVVVLTAILLGGWLLWLRLAPSVSPDSVSLRGQLLSAAHAPETSNGATFVAEVQVKRDAAAAAAAASTAKAATGAAGTLFIYVPGFKADSFAIVEDKSPGAVQMHNAPELRKQARAMLEDKSIGLSVSDEELDQGFSYVGPESTYTAHVSLRQASTGTNGNVAAVNSSTTVAQAYAVYVHQERKLGKNVSWTKAVKLAP